MGRCIRTMLGLRGRTYAPEFDSMQLFLNHEHTANLPQASEKGKVVLYRVLFLYHGNLQGAQSENFSTAQQTLNEKLLIEQPRLNKM